MSEFLININNLSLSYPSTKEDNYVLKDINCQIMPGEIFGIVGKSGSGKTSLALAIMNLLPEYALKKGKIFFKGLDIFNLSPKELNRIRGKEIGIVFQDPLRSLNPVLRINYQFREFLLQKEAQIGKNIEGFMKDILIKTGIKDPGRILQSYPHQLSGGQLQRVMIAMAVSLKPSLLIADEPTSSLDVTVESQIISLFKQIHQEYKMTIIFITHNLAVLEKLAQRMMVLYKGKIEEISNLSEFFLSAQSEYGKKLLQSYRFFTKG